MKKAISGLILGLISFSVFGQKRIDSTTQVAFVYYENRKTNLIVIPNIDRLYSFKIYRKAKNDTSFVQVAEKKKPPLPMRYNITQFGVTWEDKEYNNREIDYRILSFDKKGKEICQLKVIWENKTLTDTLKIINKK